MHAPCDQGETAYRIHAVIAPVTTVEMTRKEKASGESRVIATRRMLQPSKHDAIENCDLGRDSAGAAFSRLMLPRGERRAAAIRAARQAGKEPPKRRHHARRSDWCAAQEVVIAEREAAVAERETRVPTRAAEAEPVLCAAELIGTGQVETGDDLSI